MATPTRPSPQPQLDFGRPVLMLGPQRRRIAIIDRRAVISGGILTALTAAVAIVALLTGDASVGIRDVWGVLTGTASPYAELIIGQWRMPRILLGIVLGACLAVSGAIFQTLTANPLGSPDVIGFQTGAYTGALIVMLLLSGGTYATIAGAVIGGTAAALLVFLLASHRGFAGGVRLIITGIAVSALLASFNTWLLLTATVEDALMAGLWGAGNLAGAKWATTIPALLCAGMFLLAAGLLVRPLTTLQLGVSTATALGQRVTLTQIAAILIGVGLTALATATAGPISFIALAAPQIAKRLTRSTGVGFGSAAAVGACLLVLADLIAQRIVPTSPLPVGLITVSIGGLYFFWLLFREGRRTSS